MVPLINNKEAGNGNVARNSNGKFVGGTNRKFTAVCAVQAEAMAMKDAVSLAIEWKFQKVCLEIDSKEISQHCNLRPSFNLMYQSSNAQYDWNLEQLEKPKVKDPESTDIH